MMAFDDETAKDMLSQINEALNCSFAANRALEVLKKSMDRAFEGENKSPIVVKKEALPSRRRQNPSQAPHSSTTLILPSAKAESSLPIRQTNVLLKAEQSETEESVLSTGLNEDGSFEAYLFGCYIQMNFPYNAGKLFNNARIFFKPKEDIASVTIYTEQNVMITEFLLDHHFRICDDSLRGNWVGFAFEKSLENGINFELTFRKDQKAQTFYDLCRALAKKIELKRKMDDNNNNPLPQTRRTAFRAYPVQVFYITGEKAITHMKLSELKLTREEGTPDLLEFQEMSDSALTLSFKVKKCSRPRMKDDKCSVTFAVHEYTLPSGVYYNKVLTKCTFQDAGMAAAFYNHMDDATHV